MSLSIDRLFVTLPTDRRRKEVPHIPTRHSVRLFDDVIMDGVDSALPDAGTAGTSGAYRAATFGSLECGTEIRFRAPQSFHGRTSLFPLRPPNFFFQ